MADGTPGGDIFLCVKQFNARLGDELSLKPGDKVEVLADDSEYNDGWFMGRNIVTNEVGLYPKTFTQLIQNHSPGSSLLRSRSRRVASNPRSGQATPTSLNKLTDSFEKMNTSDQSTPSKQVSSTMKDIDQALFELQGDVPSDNVPINLNGSKKAASTREVNHQKKSSTQSLSDDLNPLQVAQWTPKQVYSYFALVLGFDITIAEKFTKHKITGSILLELDLTHLKELEFDSFGTRFEVYKEIEKLREISSRLSNQKSNNRSPVSGQPEEASPLGSKSASKPWHKTQSTGQSIDSSDKAMGELLPSANFKEFNGRKDSDDSTRYAPFNDDGNFKEQDSDAEGYVDDHSNLSNTYVDTGIRPTRSDPSGNFENFEPRSRPSSSVYDQSMKSHSRNISQVSNGKDAIRHRRNSSVISGHRRRSSMFSFISGNEDGSTEKPSKAKSTQRVGHESKSTKNFNSSNGKSKRDSILSLSQKKKDPSPIVTNLPEERPSSPSKSKTISYKNNGIPKSPNEDQKVGKRSVSDSTGDSKLKTLKNTSSQNFRSLTTSKKSKTSAFQEGIRDINPDEAIKTASFSGWMAKKSGNTLGWRSRYFTLHGTRLSYFTSLRDKRERGLIDITAHKVIPINSENDTSANDKYIALYAASTGLGRYCFKIVPPAPGFKKGLTFTQPKTHYFAVESPEDMRSWLKALMTATIDIDDSVPVVSSCSTPTVSLQQAQEMLAKAREETRTRDEGESYEDGMTFSPYLNDSNDGQTSADSTTSPNIDSIDETTVSSANQGAQVPLSPSKSHVKTQNQPKLAVDTSQKVHRAPASPQVSSQPGFSSPYLLASGLLSPRSNHSNGTNSPASTPKMQQKLGFDNHIEPSSVEQKSSSPRSTSMVFSNSTGRVLSGSRSKKAQKMLAYSSDDSGNHTFVIKPKK